jgi:cytoskeleton protein RodZ
MPTSGNSDGRIEDANQAPDPGGRLRQAREAQGLLLEEVANELRISTDALAALEQNRFDALGAAVFAKGYLKQYGARLGLDVQGLLTLYERAAGEPEVALSPTKGIRLRDERQISLWIVALLALVLIVGGLSYWSWRQTESEPVRTAEDLDRAPAALPPADTPAVESELEAEPEPEPEPEPEAEAEAEAGPARNVATPSPGAAVAEAEADDGAEAVAEAPAVPLNAVESPDLLDGPVVEVTFVEDSWAEITDANGRRLYYNLGRAGTRARFPVDRNLDFSFGNASGVELRVDGELVSIPGAARRDVVSFKLDEVVD